SLSSSTLRRPPRPPLFPYTTLFRAYPFHRINRTTFQRGVHFTRSYVGGAGANSGKDFTGKARNTDFQAFQIIEAVDFFAEPTTHLHTGVTAGYRDQVVRLIHLLHQL